MKFVFTLLFFLWAPTLSYCKTLMGVVAVPVCDLRASTQTPIPKSYAHDPDQESQLLYGEPVEIISEWNDWFQIEAPEQSEFTHNHRWQGYPGWVKKQNILSIKKLIDRNFIVKKKVSKLYFEPLQSDFLLLFMGTRLSGTNLTKNGWRKVKTIEGKNAWIKDKEIRSLLNNESEKSKRDIILQSAKEFLGDPYFWGGRSTNAKEFIDQITGVDCSGLVQIAYSVAGISLPRDSHEQFLKCTRIKKEDLKAGDLIFSGSSTNPEKVTHVAIFLDSENILEGPQTGENVRIIEIEKKYGAHLKDIEDGQILGDRILYFGSYFKP